jgi:hypothetical protein
LEANREERLVEAMGNRARLVQDLDLLGVGAHQVEDLVVDLDRVLEERGERGDRLAAARRSVHEERPAARGEVLHLAQDRFLARPGAVREQERCLRSRRGGGRGLPSGTGERRSGVLS